MPNIFFQFDLFFVKNYLVDSYEAPVQVIYDFVEKQSEQVSMKMILQLYTDKANHFGNRMTSNLLVDMLNKGQSTGSIYYFKDFVLDLLPALKTQKYDCLYLQFLSSLKQDVKLDLGKEFICSADLLLKPYNCGLKNVFWSDDKIMILTARDQIGKHPKWMGNFHDHSVYLPFFELLEKELNKRKEECNSNSNSKGSNI